jgi:hypothetical protein
MLSYILENRKKPACERYRCISQKLRTSNQKGWVEEVQERADIYIAQRAAMRSEYNNRRCTHTQNYGIFAIHFSIWIDNRN